MTPADPDAALAEAAAAHPADSEALRQRHGPNWRWWVLLTVMIGTMASIMSSTIVNVALPDMSRVFALGQERAQWLSAGFMAAMTVSMLTTPWLLERAGYRRTYATAVALLMAGGIAGGLAGSYGLVLAMRVVEGLAAGVLQPIPAIIVMHAFARHEQGKAMSVFGMGVVLAPALGPSIGGVLVEAFGWRSIFFVVVPLCLAALALAVRYLPHNAPGGRAVGTRGQRLDVAGLALMSVAIVALLNGMVHLHDAVAGTAVALLALALAAFAAFLWHQRRSAEPLMRLALFRQRQFAAGSAVSFIYGAALFGSTYLVPVFMQIGLGLPPSQAGAVLLPAGLLLGVTIAVAGRLADRLPVHWLVTFGVALLAASFALMATVGAATTLGTIVLWAIVGRIGLGFVLPSLNLGAMRSLPTELISHASSSINFVRQLGGAIGVGLAGIFLQWRLHAHGVALGAAADAASSAPRLAAFHETFLMIALVTVLAVAAAWRMREPQLAAAAA